MKYVHLALLGSLAAAASAGAQADAALPAACFEFQVQQPARLLAPFVKPEYPASLKTRGLEGEVRVQFVVDTLGRADTTTLRVFRSPDPAFSRSVAAMLPQQHFQPAVHEGRKVRQVVGQQFYFRPTGVR